MKNSFMELCVFDFNLSFSSYDFSTVFRFNMYASVNNWTVV